MQGESALEMETLAYFCVVCRLKQVKACKKYLLLSRELSFAIFWKYGSIYAQWKESRRNFFFFKKKCPASVVSCKRTESAESVDKNKTQEPVVFFLI